MGMRISLEVRSSDIFLKAVKSLDMWRTFTSFAFLQRCRSSSAILAIELIRLLVLFLLKS